MMPDYRAGNPYQNLLSKALAAQSVDVVFPFGYRRGLPIFRATCDNRPIDVLHLHWTEPYTRSSNWIGLIVRWIKLLVDLSLVRIAGVRIVWTLHNLLPHECKYPRLEKFFRRMLARNVSQVLVHGERSRTDAVAIFGCRPERVAVAPHGHYRSAYAAVTPESRSARRSGLPESHREILFFGMLRRYKGLERLLRVWRILAPPNASLRIVGPCPEHDYELELRGLADMTPGVVLEAGFVEDADVSSVFAGTDLVVLPFEQVQTSGSVILAMSFAKPVIAPRLGEIPETLGVADCLLYEPGSDDALAGAIRHGLSADLANLRGHCQTACDHLDWEKPAARTAAAYRSAMGLDACLPKN